MRTLLPTSRRARLARSLRLPSVALVLAACHRPMGKIEALRDAWAEGDRGGASHVVVVAECPESPLPVAMAPCLEAAARAFGSTGFSTDRPDQASAAAVAFVLARRRGGEGIPKPDTWLQAVAAAPGSGVDALRLAVAATMAEAAPRTAKDVEDEPAARTMLGGVASALPGACEAYAALGRGDAVTSFSPASSPDHSPCVQHDLERKDGPGAAYGDGLWRAAAGAAGLWRDGARALGVGLAITDGSVRRVLRKRLDIIEPATRELSVRVVATTQTGQYQATDAHRSEGVPLAGDGGAKRASP